MDYGSNIFLPQPLRHPLFCPKGRGSFQKLEENDPLYYASENNYSDPPLIKFAAKSRRDAPFY